VWWWRPAEQAVRATTAEARVGPNAILQSIEALNDLGGEVLTRRVFEAAGLVQLLELPPQEMVPQSEAAALHRAIEAELPGHMAVRVAVDAGRRTGAYILAHRIPKIAQRVLKLMPARWAGPMLLRAIERHAWTFAGSAQVSTDMRRPWQFVIHHNPLAIPGCPWHCAVFATLFQTLVHPKAQVSQRGCCTEGQGACVFEIDIPLKA